MTVSRPIYLDNHATTRTDPRVVEAMLPFFTEEYGNAASLSHAFGTEAAAAVEAARQDVAELVGADPAGVVFTSGATEANNLALKGALRATTGRQHLVTCVAEHPSVLDPVDRLQRDGHDVTRVGVDRYGRVAADEVIDSIRPETTLVSVMWANNEVGAINPIAEIAEACRQKSVLFHSDAVQAAGRIRIDCRGQAIDLLSLSAHKLYGPKGIGALVIRRGAPRIRLQPQLDGGGHEAHLRSGTVAVPLVVGFGRACRLVLESLESESTRISELTGTLWEGLQRQLEGLSLNGHPEQRLPGNLNLSVSGVDGDALLAGLTRIAVSSGSACTTADPEPSHVLAAMGIDDRLSGASLRFGLGRFNTSDDIEPAIGELVNVVRRLRAAPAG